MKLAVFGALAYQAAYAVHVAPAQQVSSGSFYDDLFLAQTENSGKEKAKDLKDSIKNHKKDAKGKKNPWEKNKKFLYSWNEDGDDDCDIVDDGESLSKKAEQDIDDDLTEAMNGDKKGKDKKDGDKKEHEKKEHEKEEKKEQKEVKKVTVQHHKCDKDKARRTVSCRIEKEMVDVPKPEKKEQKKEEKKKEKEESEEEDCPCERKKKKGGHGWIQGKEHKISLEPCKYNSVFEALGKDTVDAIKTLKALGGIDGCQLDQVQLEKKQCCCWGTPIGDRLMQLAEHLDPNGTTLLAQTDVQTDAETERDPHPMGRKFADEKVDHNNYPNLYKLVRESQAEKNSEPGQMLKNVGSAALQGVSNVMGKAIGAMKMK